MSRPTRLSCLRALVWGSLLLALPALPSHALADDGPYVPVPTQSAAIVRDSTANLVYVSEPALDAVLVLNEKTMRLARVVKVAHTPTALALDTRRHRLYVAGDPAGIVGVYDTRTYAPIHIFPVGGHPAGLTLVAQGTQLLITDARSGALEQLSVLAKKESQPVQLFTVGPNAEPIVLFAPPTAWVGGTTAIWARGFAPNESITVSWGITQLTRVTANWAGIVTATIAVPRGASLGRHLVILQGTQSTISESGLLTVVPAPPAPKPAHVAPPAVKPSVPLGVLVRRLMTPSVTVPVPPFIAQHLPTGHPATPTGQVAASPKGHAATPASKGHPAASPPHAAHAAATPAHQAGKAAKAAKAAKTAAAPSTSTVRIPIAVPEAALLLIVLWRVSRIVRRLLRKLFGGRKRKKAKGGKGGKGGSSGAADGPQSKAA